MMYTRVKKILESLKKEPIMSSHLQGDFHAVVLLVSEFYNGAGVFILGFKHSEGYPLDDGISC